MANIHPDHDCPNCNEPGLVDTSTNFKFEWSCNWCDWSGHPDRVRNRQP